MTGQHPRGNCCRVLTWRDWIEREAGQAARAAWEGLGERIGSASRVPAALRDAIQPIVDEFVRDTDQVAAVLFYGSCLFSSTSTTTSFPDFYLLVDNVDRYHGSRWHGLMNRVLPPNVYFATFEGGRRCKFCVMSTGQFAAETSARARDIHHLGRFSKRIGVAHARDTAAARAVARGCLSAMLTLVPHALTRLPRRFTLDQFILAQLGLSYVGEKRVAEPRKVRGLMQGAPRFYRDVYAGVLELHALRHGGLTRLEALSGGGPGYEQGRPDAGQGARTRAFLRRSRVRGILRWPKYILTVDDWVDYLLDKLERHHGVHVDLTERQRRHPLIFGWPIYFEMRRRGIVK